MRGLPPKDSKRKAAASDRSVKDGEKGEGVIYWQKIPRRGRRRRGYQLILRTFNALNRGRRGNRNLRIEILGGCWRGLRSAILSSDGARSRRARLSAFHPPAPADCARAKRDSNRRQTSPSTIRERLHQCRISRKRCVPHGLRTQGRSSTATRNSQAIREARRPRGRVSARRRRARRVPIRLRLADGSV